MSQKCYQFFVLKKSWKNYLIFSQAFYPIMITKEYWAKNTKKAVLALSLAYVGQPDSHIGWVTLMPFASINPTIPRTNLWNFGRNCSAFGDVEKLSFFESAILNFFFKKKKIFFCFIPMKTCQSLLVSKDFSKFWWLPWFPAPNSTCLNICNTVYIWMMKRNL